MVILFSRIPTDRSVVSDAVRTSFDHARVERGKSAFTLKIDLPFLFVDNRFLLSLFLSYFLRAPVVLLDSGLPEFLSKTKFFLFDFMVRRLEARLPKFSSLPRAPGRAGLRKKS